MAEKRIRKWWEPDADILLENHSGIASLKDFSKFGRLINVINQLSE